MADVEDLVVGAMLIRDTHERPGEIDLVAVEVPQDRSDLHGVLLSRRVERCGDDARPSGLPYPFLTARSRA